MLVIIILFCPTYVSEAHRKPCFILIQRFILRPTVHETGESELAAFVGLCASICLENEWLAQQFLVHNKASVALAIISNYCCNSKGSARNSVKIFFFSPTRHFAYNFVSLYFFFSFSLRIMCQENFCGRFCALHCHDVYISILWIYCCSLDCWSFKLLKRKSTLLGIYHFPFAALGRGLSTYLEFKKGWLSAQTYTKMYIHSAGIYSP